MVAYLRAVACILGLGALIVVINMSYHDELMMHRAYCDAVEDWALSGGERGHPDYDQVYQSECRR